METFNIFFIIVIFILPVIFLLQSSFNIENSISDPKHRKEKLIFKLKVSLLLIYVFLGISFLFFCYPLL